MPTDATAPTGEAEADDKPEEKKGFFGRLFGKKKKELQPKRPRVRLCLRPRLKAPSRNYPTACASRTGFRKDLPALPPLPTKKPDLPPIPDAPDMAKEMERKNLERKLERIADDRAERMSDANPDLPPLPGSGSAPENRPVYRPCPSPVAEFQNCLSCPSPAEPNPTCRLCPSRAVPPQCLLCRSRKVSRIFRLCPNQKPVVREISHPCRRFHQISNRRRLLDIRITPKNGVIWSFTPPIWS